MASEDCRSSGSTLKEALADDDLPLSLVQMKAIATRNNKTQLQNETENVTFNATFEVTMVPPSHRIPGAASKWDVTFQSMTSANNNFQAFVCTFSLACFAFILVLNGCLLCVQTQHQDKRKTQKVAKMQKPADHLTVTSKLDLGPDSVKHKLQTYSRAQRNNAGKAKGAGMPKGSKKLLQAISEEKLSQDQHHELPSEKSDLKNTLPFKVLDPRLVLPLRETWYAVTIEDVFERDGSFEILRITGFPQLRATIARNGDAQGGVLELFCSGGSPSGKKQLVARASSCTSENAEDRGMLPPIALVDKNKNSLGELRPTANDRFDLFYEDKALLTLATNDARQFQLTSACGSSLACTSIVAGHLGVCVNAGTDTGLAICITLAAVLLGRGSSLLWRSDEASETIATEEAKHELPLKEISTPEPSRKTSASNGDVPSYGEDK